MFAFLNIKNLTEQFKSFIPKINPGVTEWNQHIKQSHAQTIRLHIRKQDIQGIFCSWCLTQSQATEQTLTTSFGRSPEEYQG